MLNRDIANSLIAEAKEFNVFGADNKKGQLFQEKVNKKYRQWESDKSIKFDAEELSILKAVIAQSLVQEKMEPLKKVKSFLGSNLSFSEKTKKRTLHCLKIAKTLAACGSFNCEIANLIMCLALVKKLTIPVEVIFFTGVSDNLQDIKHTFATLGSPEKFTIASYVKRKQSDHKNDGYVICDAHHLECYPATKALSDPNVRLARYDNIDHKTKRTTLQRIVYLKSPALLYEDKDIAKLCKEVLEAKNNPILKQKVEKIFAAIAAQQNLSDEKEGKKESTSGGADPSTPTMRSADSPPVSTFFPNTDIRDVLNNITPDLHDAGFLWKHKDSTKDTWIVADDKNTEQVKAIYAHFKQNNTEGGIGDMSHGKNSAGQPTLIFKLLKNDVLGRIPVFRNPSASKETAATLSPAAANLTSY